MDLNFLVIVENHPFVIPCRVSDPEANVTLAVNDQQLPATEVGVWYDPQVGVNVPPGSWSGRVVCYAETENIQDEQSFILIVEGEGKMSKMSLLTAAVLEQLSTSK